MGVVGERAAVAVGAVVGVDTFGVLVVAPVLFELLPGKPIAIK